MAMAALKEVSSWMPTGITEAVRVLSVPSPRRRRARRRRGDGRVPSEPLGANRGRFRLSVHQWQPPVAWLLLWSRESCCRCHQRALSCCWQHAAPRRVRAGAPSRLKEPRTRQPVGRLTCRLKMGTALDQPCAHLEERTDGADVRRRDRVLEFSRGSVIHASAPCIHARRPLVS